MMAVFIYRKQISCIWYIIHASCISVWPGTHCVAHTYNGVRFMAVLLPQPQPQCWGSQVWATTPGSQGVLSRQCRSVSLWSLVPVLCPCALGAFCKCTASSLFEVTRPELSLSLASHFSGALHLTGRLDPLCIHARHLLSWLTQHLAGFCFGKACGLHFIDLCTNQACWASLTFPTFFRSCDQGSFVKLGSVDPAVSHHWLWVGLQVGS